MSYASLLVLQMIAYTNMASEFTPSSSETQNELATRIDATLLVVGTPVIFERPDVTVSTIHKQVGMIEVTYQSGSPNHATITTSEGTYGQACLPLVAYEFVKSPKGWVVYEQIDHPVTHSFERCQLARIPLSHVELLELACEDSVLVACEDTKPKIPERVKRASRELARLTKPARRALVRVTAAGLRVPTEILIPEED